MQLLLIAKYKISIIKMLVINETNIESEKIKIIWTQLKRKSIERKHLYCFPFSC